MTMIKRWMIGLVVATAAAACAGPNDATSSAAQAVTVTGCQTLDGVTVGSGSGCGSAVSLDAGVVGSDGSDGSDVDAGDGGLGVGSGSAWCDGGYCGSGGSSGSGSNGSGGSGSGSDGSGGNGSGSNGSGSDGSGSDGSGSNGSGSDGSGSDGSGSNVCVGDCGSDGSGSDGSGSDGSGSDGSGSDGSGSDGSGSDCDDDDCGSGSDGSGSDCDDGDCGSDGSGSDICVGDDCGSDGSGSGSDLCDAGDCGSDGSGSGSDCTSASTDLPSLLAGLTSLDCTTPTDTLDAILAELTQLDGTVLCGDDGSGTCPGDRAALAAALADLQALPISNDCADPNQQAELDNIVGASGVLDSCGDTTIDNTDPPPPPPACTALDWDRLEPAPDVGAPDCQIIALTTSAGSWDTDGDVYPIDEAPGAASLSFAQWERSVDDSGNPLHPADELLGNFGLDSSQIGYLQATASEDQLYAAVDLRPLESQLEAAGTIVVIYGRTNAAAAYIDEGDPTGGLDSDAPGDVYAKYDWIQDYEHEAKRDSIKILSCDATQLIGERAFTLSSRVAVDDPWTPYERDTPGVWAAVLACGSAGSGSGSGSGDGSDGDGAGASGITGTHAATDAQVMASFMNELLSDF